MSVFLLIARLFLALIFAVAGIAKAADPQGTRRAFAAFGVPNGMVNALAWLLPAIEIVVAVALLPLSTAWWGAIAALALLVAFIAEVGFNLARGKSPDCHCFGRLYREQVSWSTLGRNLIFAVLAGFIVVNGKESAGLSAFGWSTELRMAEVINLVLGSLLIGLLVSSIVFMRRLLKQQVELFGGINAIRAALGENVEPLPIVRKDAAPPHEGLPIGAMAPKFTLTTTAGSQVSLDHLLASGKPVVLLFASSSCWGCKVLLPAVRAWQRDYSDRLTVVVLTKDPDSKDLDKMLKYEIEHLLIDEQSAVSDDYHAKWSPAAVLIHPDGRVASHNVYGDSTIREWVRDVIASEDVRSSSSNGKSRGALIHQVSTLYSVREIGEPSVSFALEDLSGEIVKLEDLYGSPTLLLFWHPHCEFCKTLHDDLRVWEEQAAEGGTKLVFIAHGEPRDIKAVNARFSSRTLLDPTFDIAPLFGTKFTPSVILIDSEGRIASSLAMGTDSVRELIGLPKAELPSKLKLPEALYGARG